MPKVSVITATFNCAHYLTEAIESALAQSYQDLEIIVVDDGSTDQTRETVKYYLEKYPQKIIYIYQENQGLPAARNTGIRRAKGEFIALLDADDKWSPDWLCEEIKILESDSTIGLVHANISKISEGGILLATPHREKKFLSGKIFKHLFLRKADIACPTVLFRKACCERVGLFDTNLSYLGCEDRELWLRIAREYKIVYIDKVLAFYRVHPDSMSRKAEKMLTARLYVVNKFCPDGQNQKLKKMALARIYRDIADELLFSKNFKESSKQYLQALSYKPFSFWSWINLMKACLKIEVRHVF